ncbi:MAG: hypothetical protein ACI4ME_11870 [Aristaeellaceae bacterium]
MIPLDTKIYEVLSLGMRYFFTFLGLLIVWRSFLWLRKDRRQTHKRLRQLPDAGTIGILTVESGSSELKPGTLLPVPHEGVLGFVRTCDVVVPVDDVAPVHLDFCFVDGEGLYVYPRRGCEITVDAMVLTSRREARQCPMQHGSLLLVGQAALRLGVFAGLDVPEAPVLARVPAPPSGDDQGSVPVPPPEPVYPPQPTPPYSPYPPYPQGMVPPGPYAPVNPPVQPNGPSPDGQSLYGQPYPPAPWQGGDDHAP